MAELEHELVEFRRERDELETRIDYLRADRDRLAQECERLRGFVYGVSSLLSERHGDDAKYTLPEDDMIDSREVVTIKHLFDLLDTLDE